MFKTILYLLLVSSALVSANEYSLKGTSETVNIATNTVDTKEVIIKVDKSIQDYDFSKLKNPPNGVKPHVKRLSKIESNMKALASLRSELELNYLDIKRLESSIEDSKLLYDRKINRIYKQNKHIDRYMYILVAAKSDEDYSGELENFVIDKMAIKKFDQTTTLKTSMASTEMRSKIKTEKDFGQKSTDIIDTHIFRSKDLVLKVLKITQNPFVKTPPTAKKALVKENDQFKETRTLIYDLKAQTLVELQKELEEKFHIDSTEAFKFINSIKNRFDMRTYKTDFSFNSDKITKVLKMLESKHAKLAKEVTQLDVKYRSKLDDNRDVEKDLNKLLKETNRLLKPYEVVLTKENIGHISIITPKIYSEKVDFKEEREYILRKVKSYISKVNIADLKQSDVLIDFMDLSSTTKNVHKSVKFETLHVVPFLEDNNKVGLLVFSTISIKDKMGDDDLIEFDFENETLKFVPVKQGYKTIFVAQKQVTLGLVKEFLKSSSYKKHFDQYCIDESHLPEEAKDFKNVGEEFYDYPAICFKIDYIDNFLKWVSKKSSREMIIPETADWSYVASNSDTTDYCWGNEDPEDLLEEGEIPENIYIEGSDDEYSTIQKVGSYPKSKAGVYDMCGNVFEMTMQDGDFAFKGNSFSSYVENSRGEAEGYSDESNSVLGLRLFYIKDLTNE